MDAAQLFTAAEGVARLRQVFGGILAVEPQLLELASLVQAKDEVKGQHASATRELEQTRQLLAQAQEELAAADEKAGTVLQDAQGNAAKLLHDAEIAAKAKADGIIAEAQAKAEAQRAEAVRLADRQGQLNAENAELEQKIAQAQAKLDEINAALAEARAKIGAA